MVSYVVAPSENMKFRNW